MNANNAAVVLPFSAVVTVVSVEDAAAGACSSAFPNPDLGPTRRFILRGPNQEEWAANFRIPGLPTDLIQVGDALELSVRSSNGGPTFSLGRNGKLLVFYYRTSAFMGPFPPDLSNYGVVVSDAGIDCTATSEFCTTSGHRARVAIGSITGEVGWGQTAQVGDLSLTVEHYDRQECMAPVCSGIIVDPIQSMEMAGFASGE